MKTPTTFCGTLAMALSVCAHAHGDVECKDSAKAEWKPQMELQRKLVGDGWKVRQVKIYSNCYEVYGFDEKGARVEAFFDPKTFDRVEPKPETAEK